MTVHYKTRGLVFSRQDRQEADRVFSVFTQDFGRVEIFAKSIRAITSKLRGGIEIFSVCDLEFIQGKSKKTLIDVLSIEKFSQITSDPQKLSVACNISKTLEVFIKGQEIDQQIWDFLIDIFAKLNDSKTNNKFLYYYFFWNFMGILGHSPELYLCASCNGGLNEKNLYFSNEDGGIICATCLAPRSFSEVGRILPDTVKVLRLIIKRDWQVLSRLKIGLQAKKLLKEVSDNYYVYLTSIYG